MADFDVVICGGGVGGLTLAALLGQRGWSVLLVEKQRRYRVVHKGELIQPRSLEILQEAGLLGPLRADGATDVTGLACRTAEGRNLVSLDYRLLHGPFRHGMVQSYREMLVTLEAQLASAVTLWHGSRADGLIRDRAGRIRGVTVRGDSGSAEVTAGLTVASDGHASRLRPEAGIDVQARRYQHQLVGFEMSDAPPVGPEMVAYLTGHGLRALFDLPSGRARLYVQVPTDSFRGIGRAGLASWANSVLKSTPALEVVAEPLLRSLDSVQVQSAWRFVAPGWTRPGFALIGDSAHCVHPMVGQGMNAAIGDAWTLGCALTGLASRTASDIDSVLLRYERARRPCLDYVARLSHNMAGLLTSTSWVGRAVRPGLLRRNQDNYRLRQRLTQNMAGLTAQPLNLRDWVSASGLFNGMLSRPLAGKQPDEENRMSVSMTTSGRVTPR